MNERELLKECRDELAGLIERSVNCGDPDVECPLHDCTKECDIAGFVKRIDAALDTRAAPPATTAGAVNERELLPCPFCGSPDGYSARVGGSAMWKCGQCQARGPSLPGWPKKESIMEKWNTRAAPPATTAGAVDEIVREIDGIFHRWQTEAAPGTCMSDLHHAWNRLRAALSSRTAGEKALSYEEIDDAFWKGSGGRRGSCPQLLAVEIIAGLHAVHALVAQRGVR